MVNLLLIEGDAHDAQLIRQALADAVDGSYSLEWVRSLGEGIERLGAGGIDVVLLDLSICAASNIKTFNQVARAADATPILVLSDSSNEDVAARAVHCSHHDYIAKSRVDSYWLPRVIGYLLANKKTRDAAQHSIACFRIIGDAFPLGVLVSDTGGNCIYTNVAYHRISGLTFEQTLGSQWSEAIHPEDRAALVTCWYEASRNRNPFKAEYRFLRGDGGVVWVRASGAATHAGQRMVSYVQIVEDITRRKALAEKLSAENEQAHLTLNSMGDGVVTTDTGGDVAYINPAAEALSGWSSKDAVGKPLPQVLHIVEGATGRPSVDHVALAMKEDKLVAHAVDSVLLRPDGAASAIEDSAAPIHDREGKITGGVMVFHDVTESRAAAAQVAHAAQHDLLTSLPNRTSFDGRLTQAIGLASLNDKKIALLFMDLDQFKNVNDSLGHAIGDKLLQSVAARLIEFLPADATICRHGGDEFLIFLTGVRSTKQTVKLAEKVCAALALPHQISRHELRVTASIGISLYPQHGHNVESLFHHADTAMYDAKDHGRNQARLFARDMSARAVERLVLEARLHRALNQKEFVLHYQPKINLESGEIAGTEALIRWLHPDLGLVLPEHFIPLAEACGLIVPIGKWALGEACLQARRWENAGLKQSLPIAVNVSAMQFSLPAFLDDVARVLNDVGLSPDHLELELTESVLMKDAEIAVTALKTLHTMGVRLAIDDFGTGYSSLSYLKRFAIDTLKIDLSFVQGITNDPDDATIVSAVISMAIGLGLRVVAEGVETEEQLAFLRIHQCHEGQGYYFSRALSAQQYTAFLNGVSIVPQTAESMSATL